MEECGEGFRNVNDLYCYRCRESDCSDLDQIFFETQTLSPTQFTVTQTQPIEGLTGPLSENLSVNVEGGEEGRDY